MPTVQPPPPTPPSSAQPQANPASAVVVKAPPGLSQLTPGQSLQAAQNPQATQTLPPNQIQVQTTLGPVTLHTPLPIPNGAVLTLTLAALTPQVSFIVSEINGKPVPAAQAALKNTLAPPPAAKSPPPAPLAQGTRLNASLVRPSILPPQGPLAPQVTAQTTAPQAIITSSATARPAAGVSQAPSQAQPSQTPQHAPPQGQAARPASTTVSSTTPTTPVAAPPSTRPAPPVATSTPTTNTPATAPPTTPGPAQQATAQAAPSGGTASSTVLPAGTQFGVTVLRIVAPTMTVGAPAPASGAVAQGATLSGTVTGTTPQGQPIVQTPHATFALDTRAPIAPGARVVLSVDTLPTPPTPSAAAKLGHAGPAQTLAQANAWSDLDEALKVLNQIDPARFHQVMQNVMPQPGAKMTNQMLFFLSALKGGDVKAWLGNNATRVIERERPGLVGRLGGDFQIMSKMTEEPQSGDWRLALIPLWAEDSLEQLRMYYRGGSQEEDDEGDGEGTRFVLDVTLSNLGHLQIDGLMKPDKQRLDLIIRTDHPLPDQWRTEIGELFTTAEGIMGLSGGVAFQAAPGNFVEFPPVESSGPYHGSQPGLFA